MADQADLRSEGTALTLGPQASEHTVDIEGHCIRVRYQPESPAEVGGSVVRVEFESLDDVEGHAIKCKVLVADVEGHVGRIKFEPVPDVEGHIGRFKFEPVPDVEGHIGRFKFEPVPDVEGHCIRGRSPEGHAFTVTLEPVEDVEGHGARWAGSPSQQPADVEGPARG